MARIKKNPVAHIISGKLGDVVYYNYRGQQYVRKSPRRVETASALQAANTTAITAMSAMIATIATILFCCF